MKIKSIILALLVSVSAMAYTRDDLERLSKEALIEIILSLQGDQPDGKWQCSNFNPADNAARPQLLTRYNHPGYNDDGILKYPDGNIFIYRHQGYSDDFTIYYPNGKKMMLQHEGYNDHQTTYWPNGNILQLVHSGYNNDGTIYHADYTSWLIRHEGYNDDLQRIGLPVEEVRLENFIVRANLTTDNNANIRTLIESNIWKLEINLDGATKKIMVKECLKY